MEIRDLGYIRWQDPLAWMEKMKGSKWNEMLKREKNNYNNLEKQVKKESQQMEKEIQHAQQYSRLLFTIGEGSIIIEFVSELRFNWRWSWEKKEKSAYDIDVKGNTVWYVTHTENNNINSGLTVYFWSNFWLVPALVPAASSSRL